MKLRAITVVLALTAGVAVATAVPAAAAVSPNTFTVVLNSTAVAQFARGFATASCPVGSAMVSAGGGGDAINSIAPTNFGTAATVNMTASNAGESVFAQSQCAPSAQFAGSFETRALFPNTGTNQYSGSVSCPTGYYSFAGGGYFQTAAGLVSTTDFFLRTNTPTARGWRVEAMNNISSDSRVVIARCTPNTGTVILEENYPITFAPGTISGSANGYAHCPAGTLPIVGGASVTNDGNPAAVTSFLTWSLAVRAGQIGWFAAGTSSGGGSVNPRLHVIVRCGQ